MKPEELSSTQLRCLLERDILPEVSRPGRYIGSELNVIRKNHDDMDVAIALAFPDLYEIGMSNLGIQILYHVINRLDWAAAERVFAPWVDMEQKMREKGLPLYSLETFTPIRDFDMLGFSLPYELCYTNVLNMLDLSGIPLRFHERCKAGGPLVLAGGLGAFVPEPMWEFIDLFVVGDGEEAILEILKTYRSGGYRSRIRSDPISRLEFLRTVARTYEGVYVPHFYRIEYDSDGKLVRVEPTEKGIPAVVHKRTISNIAEAAYHEKPLVPLVGVVHDRAVVEIMRGCGRGCRFCQAGRLYRPVRELPLPEVVAKAKRFVEATGYEEVTLSSLSTGDHSQIEDIADHLSTCFAESRTAISLPSLRPQTFSPGHRAKSGIELLERVGSSKKTGITLAIEAATPRLRGVINKKIDEEVILAAAEAAYAHGWNLIKLYFMIGLPTESDEDLAALVQLVQKIAATRKRVDGRRGNVNVSIACFVPKAHTPFQWEKFHNILELKRKIRYIKSLTRGRNIKLKFHDPEKSYLEAVFSRGDRQLSSVVHRAWAKGCRLDDWSEHFNFTKWLEAFRESNVEADFYSYRERSHDEVLPWDHISCGIHKETLFREREKAIEAAGTLPQDERDTGEIGTKVRA